MAKLEILYQKHVSGRPKRELLCWFLAMGIINILLLPIMLFCGTGPAVIAFAMMMPAVLACLYSGPVWIVTVLLCVFCAGLARMLQLQVATLTKGIWIILGGVAGLAAGIIGMKVANVSVPVSLQGNWDPGFLSRFVIFSAPFSGTISASLCRRFWPAGSASKNELQ